MDRFDPFVKYADVYGDIINWEKDPMNKPQNQNKYFFSDGKTYYEQICKMLRLMSVFKEAFNQIYSNEDEISEAWENFVNNLSASVVEGSEPDVTLTWTDDSVNFEFTMVPGVPGEQGVGITSISFNSDYTMTITLSDGNTYTSMSLKGETGPQGPQGETGSGLQILDVYATLADLQSAHPTGQPGDAYQVGSEGSYTLYIWSSSQSAWVPAGSLGTVSPSVSNPLMDGTASAGSSDLYSRGDHVHPSDTSRASKEELDALIKTSQSLIDQSFTYRESPAIQDGLARIDRIKGNTLVWNQLFNISNPARGVNTSNYQVNGSSFSCRTTAENNNYVGNIGLTQNHKYYVCATNKSSSNLRLDRYIPYSTLTQLSANSSYAGIVDINSSKGIIIFSNSADVDITIENFMIIDLSLMYGIGNEPTSVEEFTSLFPLPYYAYNQGTLLSFMGNGIKTTGKNLIKPYSRSATLSGIDYTYNEDGTLTTIGRASSTSSQFVLIDGKIKNIVRDAYYFLSGGDDKIRFRITTFDSNGNVLRRINTSSSTGNLRFIFTNDEVEFYVSASASSTDVDVNSTLYPQLEISYDKTSFESYTESTTSLPISTYFPTGMKSKGDVYDELTENKAITRIGSRAYQSGDESDTSVVTDGTTTYYLLTTPTETSIDLDLSFNAYENGTEQLLPVNGSVPSTSPVIADMTYLSIDDAMEYIIDKLANVPQNTQQILESLEDDVADLQTDVGDLQPAVSALQTSVGNINTNIGQLSSTVAGHTASISGMQSDISDLNRGLSNLEDTVTDNTSRIGTLETGLSTTNGNVQNLETSVSDLGDTVTAQGTTVTALDSIISDISNNPVVSALGSHELGFVAAYVEATLAANAGTRVTIPKPVIFPNNYTPLFIVGMSTGSSDVSICEIPPTFGSRDSVSCRVWNHGSQQTAQITVYILCMRQRQSQ